MFSIDPKFLILVSENGSGDTCKVNFTQCICYFSDPNPSMNDPLELGGLIEQNILYKKINVLVVT